MYNTVLAILYLLIFIPAVSHLIRFRDIPSHRRLSVLLGTAGILLAPAMATFFCDLMKSIFSFIIAVIIFFAVMGMLFRAIFH